VHVVANFPQRGIKAGQLFPRRRRRHHYLLLSLFAALGALLSARGDEIEVRVCRCRTGDRSPPIKDPEALKAHWFRAESVG
jgi:hypothetical protein